MNSGKSSRFQRLRRKIKILGPMLFFYGQMRKFSAYVGINLETYHALCRETVDLPAISNLPTENSEYVRLTDISQLYCIDKPESTLFYNVEARRELLEKRFASSDYHCYGYYVEGVLAYVCWISENRLEMWGSVPPFELSKNEALMLDAWTHPDYRKLGIHTFMNKVRVSLIGEMGYERALVFIQQENPLAFRSQISASFHVAYKMRSLNLWGKQLFIIS